MKKPTYYLNGIMKFLQGGTPNYFKMYGIDPNKFTEMFSALKNRGLSNQVSFEVAWQSIKENPNTYYSFGTKYNNVNKWANNIVNHLLKRPIYKNAVNARNFSEYRKATKAYNTLPHYTRWLKEGREEGKKFINNYIKLNNLGLLVVYNQYGDTDQFFS